MSKLPVEVDLLSSYDQEILTLQKVREKVFNFVNDPNTPSSLQSFYTSLQKSLLDSLELVYLSNSESMSKYLASSLTIINDILKIFQSVSPSQYQLALQVSQGVLTVLKDAYGLGNQITDHVTGNRIKIKKKAGRLALSEALAQKITYEYAQILQHISPSFHRKLINAIIYRMDFKNAIGDNPSSCLSIDAEKELKDNFGLTESRLFEQHELVNIASDDIFARTMIVHEHKGETIYYKSRDLKSAKLSCLGFRKVDDHGMFDDNLEYAVILKLEVFLRNPFDPDGRKDFVNSMFLEIMMSDTIKRLDDLRGMIIEKDKKVLITRMKDYFKTYYGVNDLDIKDIHGINDQQEVLGKLRNNVGWFFPSVEKDTSSTSALLQGVAERRYVLRKLALAPSKQDDSKFKSTSDKYSPADDISRVLDATSNGSAMR